MADASSRAVFLSYASQDAEAARRICEALRAAGIEVWFDQSELTGGDAWDAKIRGQIASCALFMPVISANTQARLEGYFRLEWKLAAQRTHTMAEEKTFLLPVVVDATRDAEAKVPGEFKAVQWTRLPGGETPEKFCGRVKALLAGGEGGAVLQPAVETSERGRKPGATRESARRRVWPVPLALASVTVVALALWQLWKKTPPPAAPVLTAVSEARQLVARARALIDDDLMAVRENFRLADEFSQRAVTLDATDGEACATAARVSALILQAKYEMTPERKRTAKIQVERAGRLAPDSIETGLALATYLEVNNDPGEAERLLRRLIQRAPADKRLWRSLATNLANNDRDEEALATLRQSAGLLEEDPQAQSLMAYVLSNLGRYREEAAVLDRVLRRSPTKLAYYYQLVLEGFFRSDLAAASRILEKIPPQLMQEDSMINSAAEIWLRLGEGDKALQVLQKSPRDFLEEGFEVRPKGFLTGAALQLIGRPNAAAAEWRQALLVVENRLAGNPNQPLLLYWKGVLQALTGQKASALETRKLYRELEAKPNAWFDAILLVAVGENEQAIQGLEQAWPIAPVGRRVEIRGELLYGPWLTAIRADPRMQRLISEQTAAIERDRVGPVAAPAKADEKSVAVLAFANLSDDKANEYFSDGISEELLNTLGKVPGLKVPARTSSFYFKGKNVPAPEIAKQLGVAYVIEGSVQRAGDKVKIGARLTKAADGFQVWSDSFTRDAKDVFAVEEEIAGLIAEKLALKLGAASAAATASVNPEAFEYYAQASHQMRLKDIAYAGSDRVEELLNRALAIEPNFARARAMLAEIAVTRAALVDGTVSRFDQRNSPEQARLEAKAREAIALDPTSAEAHTALSLVFWFGWDPVAGERELRTALSLNPSFAIGRWRHGFSLMDDGRMDEALAESKLATQLDPFSQDATEGYARVLHVAGRYTEALAVYDRALALADSAFAREHKAYALVQLGRTEEAVAIARGPPSDSLRLRVLAAAGLRAEADAIMEKRPDKKSYYLLMLGRTEEALMTLDPASLRASEVHDWLFEPWFDPIRGDPRFKKFLETIGATEAHARAQAWRAAHPPEKPAGKR